MHVAQRVASLLRSSPSLPRRPLPRKTTAAAGNRWMDRTRAFAKAKSAASSAPRTRPGGLLVGLAAVPGFGALFLCLSHRKGPQAQCEGRPVSQPGVVATSSALTDDTNSPPAKEEEYSLMQKCIAEAIGTGVIVSGGCGAVCASKFGGGGPALSLPSIAAAFGASVALAVYATRDVSGAHLNPAVTASLAVHDPDGCPFSVAGPYVLAQTTGATIAAGLNFAAYRRGIAAVHASEAVKVGTAASSALFNGAFHMIPNRALVRTVPGALAVEVGLTTVLAFFVYALTDDTGGRTVPEAAAPALVGTTVAALVVPGAPLTGCGMNPARDLGPRLVAATAGGLGMAALGPGWWVYTVGPVLGGVAGGALYKATLKKKS